MNFQKQLESKQFIVLAEMNTPKGIDVSRFVMDIRQLKDRVDAVVVPDLDNGVMRMNALAGGVLAKRQGLETLIHVYCRDRNRMALQADLLAAHALGLHNLIVAPAQEISQCDHRDAAVVNDLNETGLLETIGTLQNGKDLAGFDLEGRPEFTVGCLMTPWSDKASFEEEIKLTQKKISLGASYVVTPPVFDTGRFAQQLAVLQTLNVPIVATVFLIKSVAVARYIAANEPGAYISEDLIRRIRKAQDREIECLKIAGETVSRLRDMTQAVLIQTMGWEHRLPALLDAAGL
ncbi:MAG: 5,10-methylenetetrahydrofolate reductase [Desulfobacteraceae bacterium]|nr:5,10-methylenetetrahydrofolate reductase [Desulfobacteraceae bacterium]